jgi:hypothetical protein
MKMIMNPMKTMKMLNLSSRMLSIVTTSFLEYDIYAYRLASRVLSPMQILMVSRHQLLEWYRIANCSLQDIIAGGSEIECRWFPPPSKGGMRSVLYLFSR